MPTCAKARSACTNHNTTSYFQYFDHCGNPYWSIKKIKSDMVPDSIQNPDLGWYNQVPRPILCYKECGRYQVNWLIAAMLFIIQLGLFRLYCVGVIIYLSCVGLPNLVLIGKMVLYRLCPMIILDPFGQLHMYLCTCTHARSHARTHTFKCMAAPLIYNKFIDQWVAHALTHSLVLKEVRLCH